MSKRITYQNIDMKQIGIKLKHIIESKGYTPNMIKEYLHTLSKLLNVHMEELLVKKNISICCIKC